MPDIKQPRYGLIINENIEPHDKLALAMLDSARVDVESGAPTEQLFALDWLMDEGEFINKHLTDGDGEHVLDWIVRRLPDSVADVLFRKLRQRLEYEPGI